MGLITMIITSAAQAIIPDAMENSSKKASSLIKDLNPGKIRNSRVNNKSIKARNEKYIMQFPMIISSAISPDITEALRNQIELERAYEFINVVKNEPITATKDDITDGGVLGSFHHNYTLESDNSVGPTDVKEVIEINENQLTYLEDLINPLSLNEVSLSYFYKKKLNEAINDKSVILESEDDEDEVKYETQLTPKIDDTFVNKNNASIPLYISTDVNMMYQDEKGNSENIKLNVNFGIKNVIHPLNSDDIIYHLSNNVAKSNWLVNLVKLTTGELSFIKDLLLDYNNSKERAKRRARSPQSKKADSAFGTLNTVFAANLMATATKSGKNMIPNASLVISKEEVDAIRRKSGMDLLNDSKVAVKLTSALSIIDFMIVDEINEKVHRFNQFSNVWETVNINRMGALKIKESDKRNGVDENFVNKILKIR